MEFSSALTLEDFGNAGIKLAATSWEWARDFVAKQRGILHQRSFSVAPLLLVVENPEKQEIRDFSVHYDIELTSGFSELRVQLRGDFNFDALGPEQSVRVGLVDAYGWEQIKATCKFAPTTMEHTELAKLPTCSETITTDRPRDLLVVVHFPCGLTLNPVNSEVAFEIPHEKALITFRHPRGRELQCIRDIPGVVAIADIRERQGDILRNVYEACALCDSVASTAFAATLMDVRIAEPIFACDATQGLSERPFVQLCPDRLVVGRRAELDPDEWGRAFRQLFGKSDLRIQRAVRWLRKMFAEDDLLDRFLSGWTGLETLNPLLCKYYNVPASVEESSTCRGCGTSSTRNVPRANGLKALLTSEGSHEIYKECHEARNGLVHGFKTIAEITKIARDRVADIARLLSKGISIVSGFSLPSDPDKFAWLAGPRIASMVFFEGTLNIPDLATYVAANGLPLCEAQVEHRGKVVNGKTEVLGKGNVKPPPNCSITVTAMGVCGPVEIVSTTQAVEEAPQV